MRAIHTLLIDHHPTFLRLAADYLREHYPDEITVVGTARTGEEGLTLALSLRPRVILLDPYASGSAAKATLPRLRAALPAVGLVVLSTHSENVYRRAALEAGANEVVVKSRLIAELLPAIRRVVRDDRQRRRRGKHP